MADTKKKEKDVGEVKLKNVRLSFAALFNAERGPNRDDGSPGDLRFKANFLIPKDGDAQDKANIYQPRLNSKVLPLFCLSQDEQRVVR